MRAAIERLAWALRALVTHPIRTLRRERDIERFRRTWGRS